MNDAIQRVRCADFASIKEVDLPLGRIGVMIGPNGSGKSNVLRALKLFPLMRTKSLGRFVATSGGANALLHYGAKSHPTMELELEFTSNGRRYLYKAVLRFAEGDRLFYESESVFKEDSSALKTLVDLGSGHFESALEDAKEHYEIVKTVRDVLAGMSFFHFHDTSSTAALRTQAKLVDDRYLRSDGSNLAAYLRRLATAEQPDQAEAWGRIVDLVRRVAPAIKTLDPVVDGAAVRLDWIDDHDERFAAHQLSDGTLRAIALITALAQPTDRLPKFIIIDEPELGLHPSAIRLVAELARSVSRHSQILFATQSTALLDQFEPEEVVVAERVDGATRLTRPDPATLRSWLEDYSLSEVYDKGILGGRP